MEYKDFDSFSSETEKRAARRVLGLPDEGFVATNTKLPSVTRVIEAILIGGLTAAIIHIFSLPRFEERIETNTRTIVELRSEVAQLRRDLYVPRGSHVDDLQQLRPLMSTPPNGNP